MNKMKQPLVITLITSLLLARVAAPGQEAKPANKPIVPVVLPGKGLAQHDFFYAGEARTRDM